MISAKDMPDLAKVKGQKADQWLLGAELGESAEYKGTRELSGSWLCPTSWFGAGYMTVCICQNKMNCTLLKCMNINVCKLYVSLHFFKCIMNKLQFSLEFRFNTELVREIRQGHWPQRSHHLVKENRLMHLETQVSTGPASQARDPGSGRECVLGRATRRFEVAISNFF